jgi:hypothetical protein
MVEYGLIRAVSAVLEGARRKFPHEATANGWLSSTEWRLVIHSLTKAFEKVLEVRT